MQPFSVNPQQAPPAQVPPPSDPKRRRRWFLFGCLPLILLFVAAVVVVALLARNDVRDARVERSDGTVIPPNTVTTPVPDSAAIAQSCALQQGPIVRDCAIITPPDVRADEKLPVVFLLHGFGEGPVDVRSQGDWANAVVAHRFALVTPQGATGSWNAGGCCGLARSLGVDDVDYLDGLIGDITQRPDVDPDRIFMVGFSNGGMMTHRYLCEGSESIHAAASVAGPRVLDCALPTPMPVVHIHGTGDTTVPYEGGAGIVATILGSSFPPAPDFVDDLVSENGCTEPPAETADGAVTTEDWTDCRGAGHVRFVTIDGWTHIWPINGPYDATEEILAFFEIG